MLLPDELLSALRPDHNSWGAQSLKKKILDTSELGLMDKYFLSKESLSRHFSCVETGKQKKCSSQMRNAVNVGFVILWPERITFQIVVRKAGFWALCYFIYVIISFKYFTCLTWIWFYHSYESLGIYFLPHSGVECLLWQFCFYPCANGTACFCILLD